MKIIKTLGGVLFLGSILIILNDFFFLILLPKSLWFLESFGLILFLVGFILSLIGFKGIVKKIIIILSFLAVIFLVLLATSEPTKRYDSSIRATLSSMRSEAELHIVENENNWNYSADLCDQNNGSMRVLFKALISIKARDIQCFISPDSKSWAVSTKLRDSDDIYCSDSTGFSGKVTGNITSPSCASVKAEDE
ncbi:MAG TPA: hypothetical protein VJB69_00965 [Candidatus Paceibacterota bacterium]